MEGASQLDRMTQSRRAALVLILSALWVVGPFADDMYLPAMPQVSRDLGASAGTVALTITTFIVGLALGQLLTAPLSDSLGRKRPLLAGLAVFTVTSLAAALAPSVETLIVVRLVQGLAGGAGMAIGNAVVTDLARGRRAAKLLSLMAFVGGLAPIAAPLIGAQLLRFVSWRGLFVVAAGLGGCVFTAVVAALPETLPDERRSARGLRTVGRAMAGLSRDGGFLGYTLAGALTSMAFYAYIAGSSFVFQDVYGVSPTAYGLLFGLNAAGMLAGAAANDLLLTRHTPRRLLTVTLAVAAMASAATLVALASPNLGVWAVVVPLLTTVGMFGLVWPNSTALALTQRPDVAGSAAAYNGFLRLGLGALATPLVGLGGSVSGLSMGLAIAVPCVTALPLYLLVVRHARPYETARKAGTLDAPADVTRKAP